MGDILHLIPEAALCVFAEDVLEFHKVRDLQLIVHGGRYLEFLHAARFVTTNLKIGSFIVLIFGAFHDLKVSYGLKVWVII
jgi:hypothetical protein